MIPNLILPHYEHTLWIQWTSDHPFSNYREIKLNLCNLWPWDPWPLTSWPPNFNRFFLSQSWTHPTNLVKTCPSVLMLYNVDPCDLWPLTHDLKIESLFFYLIMNKISEFGENPIIRSQVIWYTNKEIDKQTNRQLNKQVNQTNQTKYINFLAEVIIVCWIIRIKVSASTVLSKFSKWGSTSY